MAGHFEFKEPLKIVVRHSKDKWSTSTDMHIDAYRGGVFAGRAYIHNRHIAEVRVLPEFRKQGICRALVGGALSELQKKQPRTKTGRVASLENESHPMKAGCRCYLGAGKDAGLYLYQEDPDGNDCQSPVVLSPSTCDDPEPVRGLLQFFDHELTPGEGRCVEEESEEEEASDGEEESEATETEENESKEMKSSTIALPESSRDKTLDRDHQPNKRLDKEHPKRRQSYPSSNTNVVSVKRRRRNV